ncbi:MAG: WecB/TagA/CpsF family glycosyltransferase [Pirellulaceae bacterium]
MAFPHVSAFTRSIRRTENGTAAESSSKPELLKQLETLDARVRLLVEECGPAGELPVRMPPETTRVWGVPFARVTLESTLSQIERLVAARRPSFFITANLNYAMLTAERPELRRLNEQAAFIVADGMPIVWRSRWSANPLPERVAGSELIYAISNLAATRGFRLFLLGGGPGVAEQTAERLVARYPGLQIVGTECPPFRPLSDDEDEALCQRIRDARPDLLFVAFGQPKGELWLAERLERLQVPVSVQLGASFDFVAGQVDRAPRWIQRLGLEWLHRIGQDPRRLAPRYAKNIAFLAGCVARDLVGRGQAE